MASPKSKRQWLRVLPFGLIWLVFSIVYTLLERGLLGRSNIYPATGNPYDFARNMVITPVTALITGLLIGVLEVSYFNRLFSQRGFTRKIVCKSLIYLTIILFFMLFVTVIPNAVELRLSVFHREVWNNVLAFFSDYAFLSVVVYMSSVILVSQFYTEVSENIGLGVLANFLTGKYHHPKEEERIFLFLDMRSSSSIAESIGHLRYFEMLKEYYADLSGPVISYSGEIYQYVGDEVVVSWTIRHGLAGNNCIECFYAMKAAIARQRKKYEQRFGLTPEFKAGFHVGKVTTGEIGEIKKDIIFTGDILNATSRIQGLCNSYHVDILVSGELVRQLDLKEGYEVISMGENVLRGKEERIELFTVVKKVMI